MRQFALSDALADRAACARFFEQSRADNSAQRTQFREAFACALRTELTERQREALRLKYIEGLSGRAIAALWGISPSAVSRHLSRAQRRLRHLLSYNLEWRGAGTHSVS